MSATTIRLWQVEDRGEVIKFSTTPPERDGRMVFISRSVIEHISRGPVNRSARFPWRPCEVKLPDWLIEKEGL